MSVSLLALGLVAASTRVVVVAHPDRGAVAMRLETALRAQGGLDVVMATATPLGTDDDARAAEVTALLDDARRAYDSLQPQRAIASLAKAQSLLLGAPMEAPSLGRLARLQRLRGLVYLYGGDRAAAAASFVSASFLEPDYAASADEWPPETRLAYADAVAEARRRAPGILALRVEPADAQLFVDGRVVGRGNVMLRDLAPGEHVVSARAPGFAPAAAMVLVAPDGRLSEAPLYLEAWPAERARAERLAALAGRGDGPPPATLGSAVARDFEATHAVVLRPEPDVERAWLLGPSPAEPTPFVLEPIDTCARQLTGAIQPRTLATSSPAAVAATDDEQPWWKQPWVWAVAGGVVLTGAGVTTFLLNRDGTSDRLTLYVGRPR